jgi:hypothetical protein
MEVILALDIREGAKLARFCTNHLIVRGNADGKYIGDLIIKYLEGGKHREALQLFNFVTSPIARDYQLAKVKEFRSLNRKEAHGRLEEYDFKDLIEKAFVKLLEMQSQKVVEVLGNNLFKALDIESKSRKDRRKEDYSYIWRPAIEEHEQNDKFGNIKEVLVPLLRDSLLSVARKGEWEFLNSVVKLYLHSPYAVFKRLALYIMSENVDAFLENLDLILMNKKMLEDYRVQHELYALLRRIFPRLKDGAQQFILNWIEIGPETKFWIRWRTNEEGKRPSNESINQFKNYWRIERYWIIKEHLGNLYPDRIKAINQLEKEIGTPPHPEFPYWHGETKFVEDSPFDVTEILNRNDDELIKILQNPPISNTYDPISKYHRLEMVFEGAIKTRPERSSTIADRLTKIKVDPIFIGYFFRGLGEVWGIPRENWNPAWTNELESLALLVANPEHNPFQWTSKEQSNVRLNLCRFIELVVSNREHVLDDRSLTSIKNILIAMVGDPDPDAATEERDYTTDNDRMIISLNHTSGKVLHALIKYSLCYARKHPETRERLEPDVKQVLQRVLDSEIRASVFSVLGTYLANLWYLDAKWTEANVSKIFPKESDQKFIAAWSAYLKFNNIYKDIFESLKQYYLITIRSIGKPKKTEELDLSRMAQHLAMAYLQGWEELTDNSSVVALFFAKATDNLKVEFIRHIGMGLRELKQTKQLTEIPEAWTRAKQLWEYRIDKVRSVERTNLQDDEVGAFLDWLQTCPENVNKMEDLIFRSLRKWKIKNHTGTVMEYLKSQSIEYPLICIKLLTEFFKWPWDKYYYYFDDKKARQVMLNAVNSGGYASTIAAQLSSKLGEYGRFEFKDIWDRWNNEKSANN